MIHMTKIFCKEECCMMKVEQDGLMIIQCPLFHSSAYCPQSSVNFSWRRAEDQSNNCITGNFDVLERSQNMNLPETTVSQESTDTGATKTHVSARTIRVRLVFSIVNFV